MIDMPLDDRVLTALERNPYVARRSLRFETNAGRVTLRGVVATYFQKQMAQEALRHIDGEDTIVQRHVDHFWFASLLKNAKVVVNPMAVAL